MKNFLNSLETKRAAAKEEGGFSLIDVVVTVAIIVALSVGGFVSYSGIVNNAKAAATTSAADQVYTALAVNANDGGLADPIAAYNASSDAIKVYSDSTGLKVVAVNKAALAKGAAMPADYAAATALDTVKNSATDFVATRG